MPPTSQRLDLFLWCARFASQRTACAAIAESGMVRINRQPTDKSHAKVRAGDVLTLPLHGRVRVVKVLALSERRGNAIASRALYEDLAADEAPVARDGQAYKEGETRLEKAPRSASG